MSSLRDGAFLMMQRPTTLRPRVAVKVILPLLEPVMTRATSTFLPRRDTFSGESSLAPAAGLPEMRGAGALEPAVIPMVAVATASGFSVLRAVIVTDPPAGGVAGAT